MRSNSESFSIETAATSQKNCSFNEKTALRNT